jgi:Tfp pilus assembly protein PilE
MLTGMTNRESGSTIIEAMAAVVIFGCAATVLIPSYLTAMSAAKAQAQYIEALILLDDEFVRFTEQGFIRNNLNEKKNIAGASGYTDYQVHTTSQPIDGRMVDIVKINVSWPAGINRFRNVELSSYAFDVAMKEHRAESEK